MKNEINRVENITDICPTCHQKIQGVVKPDVTRQKEDLAVKENQLLQKQQQLKELESSLQQGVARLQETSNKNTLELDKTLAELKVTKDNYILLDGTIKKYETKNISLILWTDYEKTPNTMQNKQFLGTIKIYAWTKVK